MNILLIGFMGCGKSSLGKKLAKKMSYDFIDLDRIIETDEKMTINEIFTSKGEAYFRNLESQWLDAFKGDNNVIALGGGTPCFGLNMELINTLGTSVYLQMNPGLLMDRLYHSKQKRPLIESFKNDKVILLSKVTELLKEREVFYSKANITFEASNMTSTKLGYLIEMINYIK